MKCKGAFEIDRFGFTFFYEIQNGFFVSYSYFDVT